MLLSGFQCITSFCQLGGCVLAPVGPVLQVNAEKPVNHDGLPVLGLRSDRLSALASTYSLPVVSNSLTPLSMGFPAMVRGGSLEV